MTSLHEYKFKKSLIIDCGGYFMKINKHDLKRDLFMIKKSGYDWWWHSFTASDSVTHEKRAFFIEYFLINPSKKNDEPILGQLPENKKRGIKPSYLMVKCGTWGEDARQLNRFIGWKDVSIDREIPFKIQALDVLAGEKTLIGSVEVSEEDAKNKPYLMSDSGSMSWNLSVDKEIAFNVGYGAGKFLRKIHAFEMYWHAEGMKTKYRGTVIYNNRKFDVDEENCFGYADKNWGRGFTSPWIWLSSNNLKSNITNKKLEHSAFDIGGGCPKVFMIPLKRKLLSAFYYEGLEFEFNFSKFWSNSHTKFECREVGDEMVWNIDQRSRDGKIEAHLRCKIDDMILINYEAPDGSKRHNHLLNGGNGYGNIVLYKRDKKKYVLLDDIDVKNLGCEYGEYSE